MALKHIFAKALARAGIYTPPVTRLLIEDAIGRDDAQGMLRLIDRCPAVLGRVESLRHGSLSLFDTAVIRDRNDCVKALAARFPALLSATDGRGRAILSRGTGRIEYRSRHAGVLVKAGCDVNARDAEGFTALHIALAVRPTNDFAAALLDAGADVNAASDTGLTPLMIAARHGGPAQVRLLLSHGADIHILDKNGASAVWHAVTAGDLDGASMLLQQGAEIGLGEAIVQEAVCKAREHQHAPFLEAVDGLHRKENLRRQEALCADVDRLNADGLARDVRVLSLKLKMK